MQRPRQAVIVPGSGLAWLFGAVRPGEGLPAALLAAVMFLLLTAYYLLKTVREPLVLLTQWGSINGQELRVYANVMQAALLLGFVPLYSRVATFWSGIGLVRGTLVAYVLCLGAFMGLGALGVPIGIAFTLWLGIVGLLSVGQFWSLANDVYTREEGERLFPVIAIGGACGAILGSRLAAHLIAAWGVFALMALAAGLYVASLLLVSAAHRRRQSSAASVRLPRAAEDVPKRGGFRLVLRSRYLLLIGVMVLLANLVNTQGEFILADTVKDQVDRATSSAGLTGEALQRAREAAIGNFYGRFYSFVNLGALLLQALVVSRVFRHAGVRAALFILPAIAFTGYSALGLVPILGMTAGVKVAENSVDYSLQNTVRQALFLPTDRSAKYKAKAAIDTFFVRFGDAAAAGLVFMGVHWLQLSAQGFAATNVVLAGVWLVVVAHIGRRHQLLTALDKARAAEHSRDVLVRKSA